MHDIEYTLLPCLVASITALACICTEIPLLACVCGNVVVVLGFIKKFLHHVYNKPKIFLC